MASGKLIMVVGLPGTGKTYFAQILAKKIGATHLNSDKIRKVLGLQGQYDLASKEKVYQQLLRQAGYLLMDHFSVIVDATLYQHTLRQPYAQLAKDLEVPCFWIEMQANEATIKSRVSKKRALSEADFSVYQKIKSMYEPLIEDHLVLDSDQMSPQEMVSKTIYYISKL